MVQAGQIDPTYFAQQESNKSKIASAQRIREIEETAALDNRNLSAGDKARLGIDASRIASSKFDEGYMTGLDLKGGYLSRANQALPTRASGTDYLKGIEGLQKTYAGLREEADIERENYQKTLAGLNTTSGQTIEEEDEARKIYGQNYQNALNRMG